MTISLKSGSDRTLYAQLERQRLQLQAELDAGRSQAERNRLGQFATPPELAREILGAAKKLMGDDPVRFLDPAFGTGSFFDALLASFPTEQISASEGYEIDPYYGTPARRLWEPTELVLHLRDFTKVHPPTTDEQRFNLIVCNPPYVRHHHLSSEEKHRLRKLCTHRTGLRPGGLSGLYCYFLVLSDDWLREGGLALWLVPSEFMDVNYGLWVKRYLTEKGTLQRIHRFDPSEVQFGDALVSSAVVCFRKSRPSHDHRAVFSFGGLLTKPRLEGSHSASELRYERKWTRFPEREQRPGSGYVLGDFFAIKRGLATGHNSYFILTAERGRELGLPKRFLRPILPGSRHVLGAEVFADEQGNPTIEPRLVLVDCRLPEETVRRDHPTLWKYFEDGKRRGLAERYLCRHRKPWYSQENRPAAPIVATYMGRSHDGSQSPFRFIRNHSKATAANVYLLMYPKEVLLSALHSRPELINRICATLNLLDRQTLLDEGRVYGGGLHKLEPRELANAPADDIAALLRLPPKEAALQLDLLS